MIKMSNHNRKLIQRRYAKTELLAAVIEKDAFSVNEVVEKTSLSKGFVFNEIRSGNLRAKRFGKRVLVLRSDYEDWFGKKEYYVN